MPHQNVYSKFVPAGHEVEVSRRRYYDRFVPAGYTPTSAPYVNRALKNIDSQDYGIFMQGETTTLTEWDEMITFGAELAVETGRPVTFNFPSGVGYRNCSARFGPIWDAYRVANPTISGFRIEGAGHHSTIFKPTGLTHLDKFFDFSCGVKGSRVTNIDYLDFLIEGDDNHLTDPIGIFHPWGSTFRNDVKIVSLDNIGCYYHEIDNSESVFEITGSGYQHMVKELGAAYAVTSGQTLTAYSNHTGTLATGTFTDCIGHYVWVQDADTSDASSTNQTWAKRIITAVNGDGSQCTVDLAFPNSVVLGASATLSKKISFGPVHASVSAGGTTATLRREASNAVWGKANVFTTADIGRPVWLRYAGLSEAYHHATIDGITADGFTFTPAATFATTNQLVVTAPSLVCSHPASSLTTADLTNDWTIHRFWAESFNSFAMMLANAGGSGVHIKSGKLHGRAESNNDFARSIGWEAYSRCSYISADLAREKGYAGGHPTRSHNRANIDIVGGNSAIALGGDFGAAPDHTPLVDFDVDGSDAVLIWQPKVINISRRWFPVRMNPALFRRQIKGPPVGNLVVLGKSRMWPQHAAYEPWPFSLGTNANRVWYTLERNTFLEIIANSEEFGDFAFRAQVRMGTFFFSTSTALGTDPFTYTNASGTVTVAHTAHGKSNGDTVAFGYGGVIPPLTRGVRIAGNYTISNVATNSYDITLTNAKTATSSGTGGGTGITAYVGSPRQPPVIIDATVGASFTQLDYANQGANIPLVDDFEPWITSAPTGFGPGGTVNIYFLPDGGVGLHNRSGVELTMSIMSRGATGLATP